MKKSILLSVIAITAAGSLISCDKNEVENKPLDGRKEVKFSSNIVDVVPPPIATRAGGDTWDEGDFIGVYMFKEESTTIVENKGNVKYTTENGGTTGSFTATGNTIFFPDNGDKVRFMSYYPYTASISDNIYKVDVSNQSDLSKIDLLYSFDKSISYDKTEGKLIPLVFNHQLVKININIGAGDGLNAADLEDTQVSFEGLSTTADFNLFDGMLSEFKGAATTEIVLSKITTAKEGFTCSYEAIVIPEETANKAKIVFDLGNGDTNQNISNDKFVWYFAGLELEAGKEYTYNVTIKRSGIVVQATISNWDDDEEDNVVVAE